jgi:hypothetical protein
MLSSKHEKFATIEAMKVSRWQLAGGRWLILVSSLLLLTASCSLQPTRAIEQYPSSTNYNIPESFIGGGGLLEESSQNYKAGESIGDIGVGETSSTTYQINSGFTTTEAPALTFIVNTSSIAFGVLSTSVAATATSTFSVINYTSYGYIVQTIGTPPSNGAYTLTAMSSQAASSPGTEQYGINLKANTSPTTFGSNPSGGFGIAASGYDTANQYKYVNGDVIASAPKSSGQTDFTISYIVNAKTTTAGGQYVGNQVLVCTGTY